jgi:hypothetical protein
VGLAGMKLGRVKYPDVEYPDDLEHGFSMPKGNRIYQVYAQFLKDRGVVI